MGPTESAVGTAALYFVFRSLMRGFLDLDHLFLKTIESFREKKGSSDADTAGDLCRAI